MRTVEPSTSTFCAKVTCGRPSRSATMAGTTLMRASVDSEPKTMRSKPRPSRTLASAAEVAMASEPCSASSTRCMPASAPMLSALRIVSAARSGPIETTTTSPPEASAMRRHSSTAYSSSSLRTPSADSRSRVESEACSFFSAQVSGTCLTQTAIFTITPHGFGLLAHVTREYPRRRVEIPGAVSRAPCGTLAPWTRPA